MNKLTRAASVGALVLTTAAGTARAWPAESAGDLLDRLAARRAAEKQAEAALVEAATRLEFRRNPDALLAATTAPATRPDDPAARAAALERDVLAGRWGAAAAFLRELPPESAETVYAHVLTALGTPSDDGGRRSSGEQVYRNGQWVQVAPTGGEANGWLAGEVLSLAAIDPVEPTPAHVALLGGLLATAQERSATTRETLDALEAGRGRFGGEEPADRRRAADLLFAAKMDQWAGPFLPPIDEEVESADRVALAKLLDAWARVRAAEATARRAADDAVDGASSAEVEELRELYKQYGYPAPPNLASSKVERFYAADGEALRLSGRALGVDGADATVRAAAVARAEALLAKVPGDEAAAFLADLIERDAESAARLAAGVAAGAAEKMNGVDADAQSAALREQKRLADVLLGGDAAAPWAEPALRLMADNWLTAARASLSQPSAAEQARGGRMRTLVAPGGGTFTVSTNTGRSNTPAVPEATLLATSPLEGGGGWFEAVEPSLRPALLEARATLLSRDARAAEAVDDVERLARAEPAAATALTPLLLKNWSDAANPNPAGDDQQSQYSPYGGGQPQGGIALTRLRQERNLRELSSMLGRLGALPGGGPPAAAVADAFVTAHSAAEVFRPDDIAVVFGPPAGIGPGQRAKLMEAMRERLASQWRQPATQVAAGTKRDDKAVAAEIDRGYALVQSLAESADADGRDWETELAAASALFDWGEYRYGRGLPLADYTDLRDAAFARFAAAADRYAAALAAGDVGLSQETAEPYIRWFLAALGASDLAQLTRQTAPQTSQVRAVRSAAESLPGGAGARHLALFARALDGQAATVPPELKDKVMRAGLRVVGAGHPDARKARESVRYYDDLLGEVQLLARLDAPSTTVGLQPFGLHLGLRHTGALGRESGGFGRFLQQSGSATSPYMAQQPGTIDRDRLEANVRESLSEKFEVESITWLPADVEARGDPAGEAGWRYTPLAFAVLKARDGSADRVPPVRMDLDFRDQSGRVVLAVESPVVAVDARTPPPPAAEGGGALTGVTLTQTLDDNALAEEGKLKLDVRAAADGLVPDLGSLIDFDALSPWTVEQTEGGELTISGLELAGDRVRPKSERTWLLTLKMPSGAAGTGAFGFPTPLKGLDWAEGSPVYQRYEGSDLSSVSPEVTLAGLPGAARSGPPLWAWWTASAALVSASSLILWLVVRRRNATASAGVSRQRMPRDLTPFTLVAALRRMERDGAADGDSDALRGDIRRLEREHFAAAGDAPGETDDLRDVARRWLGPA